MGGYRDDLDAAVARANSLQRRVDELEGEVHALRHERARFTPPPRRRHGMLPFVVIGLTLVGVGILSLVSMGSKSGAGMVVRTPDQLDDRVPAMQEALGQCVADAAEEVDFEVRLTIEPDGRVSHVEHHGDAPRPIVSCVETVARATRFPPAHVRTVARLPIHVRTH